MRKIEKSMVAAIKAKRGWSSGNTRVVYEPAITLPHHVRAENSRVFLYGNHIATIFHDKELSERYPNGVVNQLTFKRWPSRTTCSRLRALGIGAHLVNGAPCIDGVPVTEP